MWWVIFGFATRRSFCLLTILTLSYCFILHLSAKHCSRLEFASDPWCSLTWSWTLSRFKWWFKSSFLTSHCSIWSGVGTRTLLRHRSVQKYLYICTRSIHEHSIHIFPRSHIIHHERIPASTESNGTTGLRIPASYRWFPFIPRRYITRRITTNIELPTREMS